MADISGQFEVYGIVRQREELEHLLTSDPLMEKRIQALIRKVLLAARREIGNSIKFKHGDPRQAYKAVKTAVYRQILGGSVSLYDKKCMGTRFSAYEPPRTLRPGQRGGNRRPRSKRSWDLIHYAGPDRAFVLRFLNAGAQGRAIEFNYDEAREHVKRGSQGGNLKKYGKTTNTGSRGAIAPRNFFEPASHQALRKASEQLTKLIDDLIKQEMT